MNYHEKSIDVFLDALNSQELCLRITTNLAKKYPEILCNMAEEDKPHVKASDGGTVPVHVHRAATLYCQIGNKVEGIKLVREVTGWGLREAKHFVDHFCISNCRLKIVEDNE